MSKSEDVLPALKRQNAFDIPKNSKYLSSDFEEAVGNLLEYLCTDDYQQNALRLKMDIESDPTIPLIDLTESYEEMEEETMPLINTTTHQQNALRLKMEIESDPTIPLIDLTESYDETEEQTMPLINTRTQQPNAPTQPTKTLKLVINKLKNKK